MKNKIENLLEKNVMFAPMLVLGVAIVIFGLLIRSGIFGVANKAQSVTVTGSTERIVRSDTAKWTITLSEKAYGDTAAFTANKNVARAVENLKVYLKKSGIKDEEVSTQAVSLTPVCELSSQGYENCGVGIKGQTGSENVVVESVDVDSIKKVSEKIGSELGGVNVTNNLVEFYFNKLKDIRVEMLAEATKNARERAEAVAKAGGATVGNITSLSSGVFQVTQKNSVSVDDYGTYDTTSIEKKITATVKVDFSVR